MFVPLKKTEDKESSFDWDVVKAGKVKICRSKTKVWELDETERFENVRKRVNVDLINKNIYKTNCCSDFHKRYDPVFFLGYLESRQSSLQLRMRCREKKFDILGNLVMKINTDPQNRRGQSINRHRHVQKSELELEYQCIYMETSRQGQGKHIAAVFSLASSSRNGREIAVHQTLRIPYLGYRLRFVTFAKMREASTGRGSWSWAVWRETCQRTSLIDIKSHDTDHVEIEAVAAD